MDINTGPATELPETVWLNIFGFLDLDSLRQVNTVCKDWCRLGSEDKLWANLALQIWPSIQLSPPLTATCTSVWSCTGMSPMRCPPLTCAPAAAAAANGATTGVPGITRLYYDARGEGDLRQPESSSLAVARLHTSQSGAVNAAQEQPQPQEQQEWPEAPSSLPVGREVFSAVLATAQPTASWRAAAQWGHYKGCLEWSGPSLAAILRALGETESGALVFVYANDFAQSRDHLYFPDYSPALLLTMPAERSGISFKAQLHTGATYHTKDELCGRMATEGEEEERARWADLPAAVLKRGLDWWVAQPADRGTRAEGTPGGAANLSLLVWSQL